MFSIIKNLKQLKYLAYHDTLTGLLNRNWLYKNIDNIHKQYVYFIDINNLHEVNKSGHTIGDKYILEILESIKLYIISKDDIFVRYAGDEFIIFSNKNKLLQTNSFYCVGYSKIEQDIQCAICNADEAMIKEKNKRNQK
jgi:GGDEF domain-containing protein